MASQSRDAAIVGIYELPERKVAGLSPLQIKAECAAKALADAGLTWSDVDAVYDAQDGGGGLNVAEYFGLHPRVMDTTQVGGSSYEFHAAHARADIAAGRANVALLTYGSTQASAARRTGTEVRAGGGVPDPGANMEGPWGQTLISMYAMAAHRHMHEYGTTSEQLAEIATATRAHAMRNPQAVKAMEDLLFLNIRETTIEDVVTSRMIANPLHLLDCCMVSDGGGRGGHRVAGGGAGLRQAAGLDHRRRRGDGLPGERRRHHDERRGAVGAHRLRRGGRRPGRDRHRDDLRLIHDHGAHPARGPRLLCAKGEGGAWVEGGRLRWDRSGGPALNTDGGGLSSNHPGMRGIFLLLESARQLRGESTSQVEGAALAVAHGNGGQLAGRHSGGTIVLARD